MAVLWDTLQSFVANPCADDATSAKKSSPDGPYYGSSSFHIEPACDVLGSSRNECILGKECCTYGFQIGSGGDKADK